MSQEIIREMLRESGRGMTLEELALVTGISKGSVQRHVNTLWRKHEVSRMYKFNELNVRYVYYYYGGRMPGDNGGLAKWPRKKATLIVR